MKRIYKNGWYLAIVVSMVMMGTGMAQAGMFEGTVQGFNCVVTGKTCPIDRVDPHLGTEKMFVIAGHGPDEHGHNYRFVTNLDRSILARHALEKARVTGKENVKYRSIVADKLEVYKNGKWKTVWTQAMQDEIEEAMYGH